MSEAKVPGILAKVFELQKRAGAFKKDKQNPHFKYGYASAEGVSEAIKPLFAELGIVVQLNIVPAANMGNVLVAQAALTLIDPVDGSSLEFSSIGSGADSGDKAAMKAATAAQKYATIAAAFGASGDDPEADAKTDAPKASPVPGTSERGKTISVDNAPAPAETFAVTVAKVGEVTRQGKQPFKIETDQGVLQNFDKKLVSLVESGDTVVVKKTRFGLDIVEVVGKMVAEEPENGS